MDLMTLGDVSIFEGIPKDKEEILYKAEKAEILMTSWTKLDQSILDLLPKLRFISVWATGYDSVNTEYAATKNIQVSNVPAYATESVAELTLGLILSVMRKISMADKTLRTSKDLNWKSFQGRELRGKTLGVLGTGNIGRRVLELSKAFGMNLLAFDLFPSEKLQKKCGVKYVTFENIFPLSDIVSIHLPLSSGTQEIISDKEFALMKSDAILINAARHALVNQGALLNALQNKVIAGAGLDDMDFNQPSSEILLNLNNLVMTPHIGFNTIEAVKVKTDICLQNVVSFIKGKPQNLVI